MSEAYTATTPDEAYASAAPAEAHAATEPDKQRVATVPETHAAAAVPHPRAATAVPRPRVAAAAVPHPRAATAQPPCRKRSRSEGATTKDRKPKLIDSASAHPSVKAGLDIAMETEWQKHSDFSTVVACPPDHWPSCDDKVIGRSRLSRSSWTDRHEHLVGTSNYQPRYKARLVSRGNFESFAEGDCVRSDSPTAEPEGISILCSYAASRKLRLNSADITNAYFQGRPLERLLLVKPPAYPRIPDPAINAHLPRSSMGR